MPLVLKDRFGRIHDYLRISLTDRCNLNCIYCDPRLPKSLKLDKKEILNFDELLRLIRIFTESLGIRKVRFTGGEPMLRKDIMKFFEALSTLKKQNGFEFAVTTNGTLLEGKIKALKSSGLDRINLSLDSLRPEVFKYITGSDKLSEVIKNIRGLEEAGFQNIKINMVVMRNINDHEALEFADFFKDRELTVRFIEFMPFENNGWTSEVFVSSEEVRENIEKHFRLERLEDKSQIADLYRMRDFKAKLGFIRPVSQHFCFQCNRLRLKANGRMKLCLFDSKEREINLMEMLRQNSSESDIIKLISESLSLKEKEHPDVTTLALENRNSMQNIGG